MNAFMERWVRSCRHELLDRTLIWNQRHLLHALQQYEQFYNNTDAASRDRELPALKRCPNRSPTQANSPG
jgi:hypothetical protein